MKKIGIIVEYNPLHNGHVYHINKIKELANPDLIISVISSTFTMRGDLSLFDKFKKASHAINVGVDLVLELPLLLCVDGADNFAFNAVKILSLAKVDEIWIGSENDNIKIYDDIYNIETNISFKDNIIALMKNGLSYKEAFNQILINNNISPLLSNDTLGYSYYKALKKLNSNILLKTIKRIGDHEESKEITSLYPSASNIRKNFNKEFVPKFIYDDYNNYHFDNQKLYDLFRYQLLISNKSYKFDEEGIKNYLIKFINEKSLEEFLNKATNKRYTKSRIKRFMIYQLLQIDKSINTDFNFIRVLITNQKGLKHLNQIKKDTIIYTNIKEGINDILDIEIKASKLIDLIYNKNIFKAEQSFKII